jgi:beta-lactamase regulating signal transducer with metallopeptidase domain
VTPDLLLDLGWKSAAIAALVLLIVHAAPRLAASERVMVLRAGIAVLLMLPLFALAMPVLELAVLPAQAVAAADPIVPVGAAAAVVDDLSVSPLDWMPWAYGTGVALVLLRLIAGLVTLWRWTRSAVPPREVRWTEALAAATARLRRPVKLLVSHDVPGPLSWGIAPTWLLIAATTEKCPEQAEAVIAHELAHVRRFDWPVLMAARIVTALYWFNPLVWLLARTLARETELAADDDAMRYVAQVDYAQTLLTVASPAVPAVACGMTVSRSMLAGRIRRVLETRQHRPASRLLGGMLLIGAPAAAAPLAAMQFVPAATLAAAEAGSVVQTGQQDSRQREAVPSVSAPIVAVPIRSAMPSPARRSDAVEVRDASAPDLATADQAATPRAAEVRERRTSRPRRSPEMEEKRTAALRLSDSANGMRAEAARIEADIKTRDVSPQEREGTLAGARAMRAEAQRRDDEARRLIFGP